ncbi:CBS domain-containing protein [Rhodohalobacter sp.]|uniref:CBS domain-containing protein n=1 Tax=Rhodohalobacter sp. TaxID=1974210 RepID=UPI002ACD652D|nr:CBS domain-containing protein [Rhodohalobacter sp.]MDZ7756512.1 CBS domain-containing protein [Rhodohalobacter sp.]
MGTHDISIARDPHSKRKFLKHLMHDVEAIEAIMERGLFESGITRIGAEQEFCLVDRHFKPSLNALDVLQKVNDSHFTPELARYNLEINLDPRRLTGDSLSAMHTQLDSLLGKASEAAQSIDERVILAGILPSIDYRAVQKKYMTPRKRYEELAKIILELRGEDFELNITGVDELMISHQNILFEACNTSFQCHYQIEPEQFADSYNWAQLLAGPVLSIAANSPLLLGKQLWAETRIALFQQSIDTRGKGFHLRQREQRVTFGNRWIKGIGDVFKNDIARHTLLFYMEIERDSLDMLEQGEIPKLEALQLHNGTIYKWNRPCYGVSKGKPHLRIENRYLPSGPTTADEIANLAFWSGLMANMPEQYAGNWDSLDFDDAKENFYKAAMWGIQSGMVWEGQLMSAMRLILEVLLPMSHKGLEKMNINEQDIERYLGIIRKRAEKKATGARWMVGSYRRLKDKLGREEASVALTAILDKRRRSGTTVDEWELVSLNEIESVEIQYDVVSNVMSSDLITVSGEYVADLVLKIMEWRDIRHIPVEDKNGQLKGIITKTRLDRYLNEVGNSRELTAADVMDRNPTTIKPDDDIKYAMLLMVDEGISCLPVIEQGKLIGILTDKDTQTIWTKIKRNTNAKQ